MFDPIAAVVGLRAKVQAAAEQIGKTADALGSRVTLLNQLLALRSEVSRKQEKQSAFERQIASDQPHLQPLKDVCALLTTYHDKPPHHWSNATPVEVVKIVLQDPVRDEVRNELERLPIRRFARSELSAGYTKRTDPLDDLIASLEHEHIECVRREGKNSEFAIRTREAIDAAYAYRSGLVYIRPPAAFLKSSYPVTSLQDNSGGAWENMLSRHAVRSVPIFGAAVTNGNLENLRTRAEIDKQFWQTINTVRVAGGGNTNYVMVKDDIGNWYVKNFSGDPEPIIKAARATALFSLGPSLGNTNLLGSDLARQARARGQAVADPSVESFNRTVGPFRDSYAERTRKDAKGLKLRVGDLDSRVSGAIGRTNLPADDREIMKAALGSATVKDALRRAEEQTTKAALDTTPASEAGNLLSSALKELNAVRLEMLAAVGRVRRPARTELDAALQKVRAAEAKEALDQEQVIAARVELARATETASKAARDLANSSTPANEEANRRAITELDVRRKTKEDAERVLGEDHNATNVAKEAASEQQAKLDAAFAAVTAANDVVRLEITGLIAAYHQRRSQAAEAYDSALDVLLRSSSPESAP